ncbi:SIR2 family protein [Melittangium boletus]|uniref:SIR2 family protein n=1 Tax=Melittangium boletus TaxID=83453 RepID=UPI003DA6BA8B
MSGESDYIGSHDRLLRSLDFNDEDYSGHALRAIKRIAEGKGGAWAFLQIPQLRNWLAQEKPATLPALEHLSTQVPTQLASNAGRLLALAEGVKQTFEEDDWLKLGIVSSLANEIEHHPRLLRSLRFGDHDYEGCVMEIFGMMERQSKPVQEFLGGFQKLRDWLSENHPDIARSLWTSTERANVSPQLNLGNPQFPPTLPGASQASPSLFDPVPRAQTQLISTEPSPSSLLVGHQPAAPATPTKAVSAAVPPAPPHAASVAPIKVATTAPASVVIESTTVSSPPGISTPGPIEATVDRLLNMLTHFGAVVWVGAGASQAAGYPGTKQLLEVLRQRADDPLPITDEFTEVVDAFVASMGRAALEVVLEQQLGKPHQPTAFHLALANLVKAGVVRTVITTNYDPLLENSFHKAGVQVTKQVLDDNFKAVASHDTPRLFKVHGDLTNWKRAILSGNSYADFSKQYERLEKQLDLMRQQHAFVFVGCSMLDPRILDWLNRLGVDRRGELKPWRALMRQEAWNQFKASTFNGCSVLEVIQGSNLRPFIGPSFEALEQLWVDAAGRCSQSRDASPV